MRRILIATALCAAFAGSAFAQSSTDQQGQSPIMKDPELVGSFYTDETMTEMRPVEEMRTAYGELTEEQRALLREQCEAEENRGTDATALCSHVMTF